jgi:hypothetical protein
MNNKIITSKKKQQGAIGAVMLLALTFVLIAYSISTRNKLINDINDQKNRIMDENVAVIASQLNTLKLGIDVWFVNSGFMLLYPTGTCGGPQCVGTKMNILPGQAASLRTLGGFTNGFARNQRTPNEINFYSPLGRPYTADVVKEIDVARPGQYVYKILISQD